MIVEYLRYAVDQSRSAAFFGACSRATRLLQSEWLCLSYELSQGRDRPGEYVLRVVWKLRAGEQVPNNRGSWVAPLRPFDDLLIEHQRFETRIVSPLLPEKGLPTLYEWCGGAPAITALIDAFYDRVEGDPLLSSLFPSGVAHAHREHVVAWWSEVFGGPADYTGMGGYPRMLAHHLGLDITPEQRQRFALLLGLAADDAGLPDDPEFRAAFAGYVEWGTRIAFHNSQTGANVVRDAPVPRWGWGVAPPYVG